MTDVTTACYVYTIAESALARAFQNGRTLAKAGAPATLLAILQRGSASAEPDVAAAACSAIKRLAVNDEICTEFADAGGVETCLQARAKTGFEFGASTLLPMPSPVMQNYTSLELDTGNPKILYCLLSP